MLVAIKITEFHTAFNMKMRRQQTRIHNADSPKEFLQMLQSNRGTWVTDQEAAEWRTSVLESLAYPPKLELPVALAWLSIAITGAVILAIAVVRWMDEKLESAVNFLGAGILLMVVGVYFFISNYLATSKVPMSVIPS